MNLIKNESIANHTLWAVVGFGCSAATEEAARNTSVPVVRMIFYFSLNEQYHTIMLVKITVIMNE